MTLAEEVATFAATSRAGLGDALRKEASRRVVDVLGNCLAASRLEPARIAVAVADDWGGRPVASVVGGSGRYPAPSAALVNGTLAHALDFDDTHLPSVLHPSSSVVPAALAAGEARGAAGAAVLDAIAVGDEVCVRLGMAGYDAVLGNSIFFERGLHATAICGAIGSAVAVAMIYGLDESGIASALGIAASMGAGLLEANRTGGTVKRVHCGWAAHCGVAAADLAGHGLTGPPTVLEGRFGFFTAFCGEGADPQAVVRGLGTDWELHRIFFKPYPCNHFTHAGIDAARQLVAEGLHVDAIEDIELGVPTAVLRTIAEPTAEKAKPPTGYAAAFSGPYTVAAGLLGGGGLGVYLEDFTDEAADDSRRLKLAGRVRCVPDAACDRIFPNQFPAVLRVRTFDGSRFEARIDVNRGGPNNPLSDAEVGRKFALNAGQVLSQPRVAEVRAAAESMSRLDDVGELLALTRVSA